ncbi:glutathione S-transferase kappa 1 isoform 3-T3 [Amazona ochrocephala]
MGRTVVELFYDVVSPYSWLGFEVLCRYQHIWNIDLRFRPAFLGGIMQATGNKPPAMLPKRAEYLLKDVKRMGKYYQVPVHISGDDFKRVLGTGTLEAMRFITAIDMTQPQYVESLSREFWLRFWSQVQLLTDAWISNRHEDKLGQMITWKFEKFQLEKRGFNFLAALFGMIGWRVRL